MFDVGGILLVVSRRQSFIYLYRYKYIIIIMYHVGGQLLVFIHL